MVYNTKEHTPIQYWEHETAKGKRVVADGRIGYVALLHGLVQAKIWIPLSESLLACFFEIPTESRT